MKSNYISPKTLIVPLTVQNHLLSASLDAENNMTGMTINSEETLSSEGFSKESRSIWDNEW